MAVAEQSVLTNSASIRKCSEMYFIFNCVFHIFLLSFTKSSSDKSLLQDGLTFCYIDRVAIPFHEYFLCFLPTWVLWSIAFICDTTWENIKLGQKIQICVFVSL